MKLLSLWAAFLLLLVSSCDRSDDNKEFEANYTGTFIRMEGSLHDDPIVANVTLNFTNNTYSGISNSLNYPAICSGTFTISQTKIIVHSACVFTANFDWTYIFQGEFNYVQNGNTLRVWRTYPNGASDTYLLTKQN